MAQCFGNHEDTSTKGKQMPVVSQCLVDFFASYSTFLSISDQESIISTLYPPLWQHKFLRRLALHLHSSEIQHEEGEIVLRFTLAKAPLLKVISTLGCC